tara:strand:+ start:2568 stop:2798 length:231 start_codon:yes stop_codon:yes gene_type:complete
MPKKIVKAMEMGAGGKFLGPVDVLVEEGQEPPLFVLSEAAARFMAEHREEAEARKRDAESPKPVEPRRRSKGPSRR